VSAAVTLEAGFRPAIRPGCDTCEGALKRIEAEGESDANLEKHLDCLWEAASGRVGPDGRLLVGGLDRDAAKSKEQKRKLLADLIVACGAAGIPRFYAQPGSEAPPPTPKPRRPPGSAEDAETVSPRPLNLPALPPTDAGSRAQWRIECEEILKHAYEPLMTRAVDTPVGRVAIPLQQAWSEAEGRLSRFARGVNRIQPGTFAVPGLGPRDPAEVTWLAPRDAERNARDLFRQIATWCSGVTGLTGTFVDPDDWLRWILAHIPEAGGAWDEHVYDVDVGGELDDKRGLLKQYIDQLRKYSWRDCLKVEKHDILGLDWRGQLRGARDAAQGMFEGGLDAVAGAMGALGLDAERPLDSFDFHAHGAAGTSERRAAALEDELVRYAAIVAQPDFEKAPYLDRLGIRARLWNLRGLTRRTKFLIRLAADLQVSEWELLCLIVRATLGDPEAKGALSLFALLYSVRGRIRGLNRGRTGVSVQGVSGSPPSVDLTSWTATRLAEATDTARANLASRSSRRGRPMTISCGTWRESPMTPGRIPMGSCRRARAATSRMAK
jgi:hypothetical protein